VTPVVDDPTVVPCLDAAYVRPAPPGPGVGWLRRLGPFVRRHRAAVVASLVMSVVAQILIGLLPLIQQMILDHSIIRHQRPMLPLIGALILAGAFGFTTNYGRRYFAAKVAVGLQHDLRLAMHRHLYELDFSRHDELDFSRHDELSVGDVMSRSTADVTLILLFFNSVPMLVANLTLVLVALAVMFVLSPLLSLVIVVFVPLFA
jgi:ATP-binding cassette subfamily B protein